MNKDMIYRFKYYFIDGTIKYSDCKCNNPLHLYNDFDGLIDWEEFNSLEEKELTLHDILELAIKAYKGFLKDFYRIEIINTETKEILDYIQVNDL